MRASSLVRGFVSMESTAGLVELKYGDKHSPREGNSNVGPALWGVDPGWKFAWEVAHIGTRFEFQLPTVFKI